MWRELVQLKKIGDAWVTIGIEKGGKERKKNTIRMHVEGESQTQRIEIEIGVNLLVIWPLEFWKVQKKHHEPGALCLLRTNPFHF